MASNREEFLIVQTEPFTATGLFSEPTVFMSADERRALGDKPVPRQTVSDEDSRLALDVECLRTVENYGERSTQVLNVRVPDCPEVRAGVKPGPISFDGLRVTVSAYVVGSRAALRTYYAADGVASAGKRGD